MRTLPQIYSEIESLKSLRLQVPAFSSFNDNNREAIDAQIAVLENNHSEAKVYDLYSPTDVTDDIDECIARDIDRDEGRGDTILDEALEAHRWMIGEKDSVAPSSSWMGLIHPPIETDVKKIAKAIKFPLKSWAGHCHEVASMIYKAKLVPDDSRVEYGIWHGPISPNSKLFAGRAVTHHGWIQLKNGEIYDPTRYAFENKAPYIWVGRDVQCFYDFGGNRLRERLMDCSKAPAFDAKKKMTIVPTKYRALFGRKLSNSDPVFATMEQLGWMGSLPLHLLGEDALKVYTALKDMDLDNLIPIDNRRKILGDD